MFSFHCDWSQAGAAENWASQSVYTGLLSWRTPLSATVRLLGHVQSYTTDMDFGQGSLVYLHPPVPHQHWYLLFGEQTNLVKVTDFTLGEQCFRFNERENCFRDYVQCRSHEWILPHTVCVCTCAYFKVPGTWKMHLQFYHCSFRAWTSV